MSIKASGDLSLLWLFTGLNVLTVHCKVRANGIFLSLWITAELSLMFITAMNNLLKYRETFQIQKA